MAAFETHGLAGEIRASITSEQFDLGGYTEQRAKDLIVNAFSAPLEAPREMVRFTFVVGGGKLVRARYAEDLPKWITSALRDIGFTEDRSAALSFDSQGTYKHQHDTGQNLKTVSVFPRVACATPTSTNSTTSTSDNTPIDTKSPEYIITACELNTLKEIYASKTSTWRQRKKMLKILQDAGETFKALEAKLIRGEQLTEREQSIYDANSGQDNEKLEWLQSELKSIVENGQLTSSEKEELSKTLSTNITSISEEIEKANQEGKAKRVEKLQEKKQQLQLKKDTVDRVTPIVHRLKHAEEIVKLRVKLLALAAVEDKGRSMSLTLADLKQLEEKSEIETQVAQLEAASKGWFEDEDDFEMKCKAEEREAKSKYAAKVKAAASKKSSNAAGGKSGVIFGKAGSGGGPSSGSGGWSTMPSKKGSSAPASRGSTSTSKFAAAFGGDSDSDS